ncbi:hypothetical protein PTNB73_07530 [Pyrenophora teres f. teres]|nr:hypothetical protein HRS9139_06220 [Pyrenophora teres f. teres]KAE8858186.1 hypothetical protein PTNB29_07401 [Pyrenophora teres f. teres]KAE8861976.1 hypothetical protein PTNB73_07530 [Pyrenophora teres f. teres]
MSSTFIKLVLATLLAQGVLALDRVVYTPPPPAPTAGPNCKVTVYDIPSNNIDCTFFQETTTSTFYTECHGCALVTQGLGLGLPCRAVTTISGTATKNVTSCSPTPTPTPTPTGDCDEPDTDANGIIVDVDVKVDIGGGGEGL